MKQLIFLFNICFFLSITAFGQTYEKIKDADTGPEKIKTAEKFAVDYLTALKNGSAYTFKEEATELFKQQLTAENQKKGYEMLKEKFGDFKSLTYIETWIPKGDTSFKIIRFKSDFDKTTQKMEVRVILNENNKVAGFWIKPWLDMLN